MDPEHRGDILANTKTDVFNELKENLRPEFLNRIDNTIMFLPLTKGEIKQILRLLLRKVEKMLARQNLSIKLSENAMNHLADLGYDPQFGARPMKRVLQREVTDELAKHILASEFLAGDTIYIDAKKGVLTFGKEPFSGDTSYESKEEKKEEPKKPRRRRSKSSKEKDIEALKKATKDVEDAVKEIKK